METIEVIVFITIAIILGGMLIHFLVSLDVKASYNELKDIILKSEKKDFKKLDKYSFIVELYNAWDECGLGNLNTSRAVYVQDSGILTKGFVFNELKKLNYCDYLQSKENDCGSREDLTMSNIPTPNIIVIQCNNNQLIARNE